MNHFIKSITTNYFNFFDRAPRSEYWMFILFYFLSAFILSFILGVITFMNADMGLAANILMGLYILYIIIPNIAVTIRRLHDLDKSGWWIFITFIPIVGSIIFIVFMCTKGTDGRNQFGPDPLQP